MTPYQPPCISFYALTWGRPVNEHRLVPLPPSPHIWIPCYNSAGLDPRRTKFATLLSPPPLTDLDPHYRLENALLKVYLTTRLQRIFFFWGAGMAQWWEHLLCMCVEFVGSLLCTERFSPGTPVSPLLKNQHLTWFAFIVSFSLEGLQLVRQR